MPFRREIEELRELQPSYPFLSLYLTVQHGEAGAEAMRVFVRARLREELKRAAAARVHERLDAGGRRILSCVEDVIHGRVERASHGVAVFACEGLKLFRVVGAEKPFANRLVVAAEAHLDPLASPEAEPHRFLACLVDSRSAGVLQVGAGSPQPQAEIQSAALPRHHQGGWSQTRFQRHVDDQVEHHFKEVAAVLAHLSDREPREPIVLAGPETVVTSFRAHLPQRVRERVVAQLPVALKANGHEMLQRLSTGFEQGDAQRQADELRREVGESLHAGRGARDLDGVLAAVNECAVQRLFLSGGFEARGWRCTGCGALGTHVALSCPYCMASVATTDLRPHVIESVLAAGGEVHGLPPETPAPDGLLAQLRFRA